LTTILGPNGAGKTTLLRALTGLIPHADEIRLDGDLKGRTWDLAVLGLVMVPEGRIVSRDMSVDANLCLGAYSKCFRNDVAPSLERVYDPSRAWKNGEARWPARSPAARRRWSPWGAV
jgi:branched-chain amino acid transport system ATP-binding protein